MKYTVIETMMIANSVDIFSTESSFGVGTYKTALEELEDDFGHGDVVPMSTSNEYLELSVSRSIRGK